MAAITPISATQRRVCALYGIQHDDSYDMARRALEAAGLPGDGCPAGHTWRSVKKLADDELRALLPAPTTTAAPVATAREAQAARSAAWQQRERELRAARAARLEAIQRGTWIGREHEDNRDELSCAVSPADQATAQQQLREDY